MRDPYKVLGVSPLDDYNTVKNAYRNLCKKYHPDISGFDSAEKFKEVNEAWKMVSETLLKNTEGCEIWVHDSLFSISKRRV